MLKTTFIGHRYIFDDKIKIKLYRAIEKQILQGCKYFTMGTHGDFDKLALSACRELRKKYKDIIIEVVLTSLNKLRPEIAKDDIFGDDIYTPYSDVKTTMYDIEDEHFKRRIVVSNQKMIDSCDTLICYVDENRTNGGAIRAYKNAKKKDLHIANLM